LGNQDQAGTAWVQACINAGYPNNTDFNGASRYGCGYHLFNVNSRGNRNSAVYGYLPLVKDLPNFKLLLNAVVTKVLFSPRKVAYGVQLTLEGRNYTALAFREIILSAGGFGTPKLLMLSGIGLPSILTPLGIPVISNLPVGTKMMVHGDVTVRYNYPQVDFQAVYDVSSASTQYAQFGTGPFAYTGYFGEAFVKSDPSLAEPNLSIGTWIASGFTRQVGVQLALHQPQRTPGFLNITSTNIFAAPILNYNIWDSEYNVNASVAGLKIIRQIMSTYPATTIFGNETVPGPSYQTDAEIASYVRSQPLKLAHLWGGAVLGNDGDDTAVLDPRARVKGVTGLRVCDLSIVPGIMGGHPNGNVIMFGEKISDYIIQDNRDN